MDSFAIDLRNLEVVLGFVSFTLYCKFLQKKKKYIGSGQGNAVGIAQSPFTQCIVSVA